MTATFSDLFAASPEGEWSAPGRVNLIGEHTDYNGGLALPIAIDRYCRVQARRRSDPLLRIYSRQRDELVEVEPTGARQHRWSDYVAGTVWALEQLAGEIGGADLLIDSDVPAGAGLSSSAALECATATAFADLYRVGVTAQDLVAVTHRAEVEVVGAPVGRLDQTASLLGRSDHALLLDFTTHEVTTVPLGLHQAGLALLVMDTHVTHAHATGGYAERRKECAAAARTLGVELLSAASLNDLEGIELPPGLLCRARHVLSENERVTASVTAFAAGAPQELGRLLLASHHSLRDDFEVSTAELDLCVRVAVDAGALGARMTGGGFGGSAVALVPASEAGRVARTVRDAARTAGFSPIVFPVRPVDGAWPTSAGGSRDDPGASK